jgi:hypothetical protein
MRTHFRRHASFAAGLGACVLIAAAPTVGAQHQLSPVQIEADRLARQNARADTLEEQARTLYSNARWYVDAARLHRRAAALRGVDPRAVASFRSAAWLYSVAGIHQVARDMMEQAAERAKSVGDVEGAANSYIDAAFLAIASGREDQVPAILRRVHAVLGSPILPAERRASVLQRIGGASQLARLDSAVRANP